MHKAKLVCSLLFMLVTIQVINAQPLFTESSQLGEFSVWSISLEDLDGDEDLDACIDGQIWSNDGKGNFSRSDKSIGGGGAVDFGDLNGDKFTDAVCDSSILFNDGNWNFVKQSQTFGRDVKGAWLLDIDNDNDLDAVTYTDNSDMIWYNDGSGTFTKSSFSPGGWGQCKYSACDINKDGFTDIIVGIPHTPPPSMNSNINDKIWLGGADSIFTVKTLTSTNFETRSLLPADFDGDGDIDLFMGKGNLITSAVNWSKVLFNDGAGNFTDSGQKINSGYNSPDAQLADLDNDGDLDIFIVNGMPLDNGQPNTVWLNDGTGNFKDSGLRLGNSNSMALALGDIDSDTDIDALVGNVDIKTYMGNTNVYVNTTKTQTGLGTDRTESKTFKLNQNYPNPFNPTTTITFSVSQASYISLAVYDALAREIAELADGFFSAGQHNVSFTAEDLSTGIYYYKLRVKSGEKKVPDYVEVKKMILIK